MYKEQTQLPRPFHPSSFHFVTNPRLFSSLLLQYSATHVHFLLIVFLFQVFIFLKKFEITFLFFLLNIVYILYIYKLYIYIHIYMSGYLVLVYFFLWSPGILQERYFETETFLCLDWKDAHWVCTSFLFWLLPKPHPSSISHFHILAIIFFSPCPLGFEGPTVFVNFDLIYSTNVWKKWELNFVWDADCVLKMIIIYANPALPSPSSNFPHKKVTWWGFLLEAEEQSWPTEPQGL